MRKQVPPLFLGAGFCEHLLKARIAAERIPDWVQPQFMDGDVGGRLEGAIQQREGGIEIATHHVDAAQDENWAVEGILRFRQQIDRAFCFGLRLFAAAEPGINQPQQRVARPMQTLLARWPESLGNPARARASSSKAAS